MITIVYDEKEKNMILQASGHAGYAEKGSDIVCAAVSALMQTLAYSVDGGTVTRSPDDCNTLTVQAEQSFDNSAKFELVTDGLMLLAKQYPENVCFINMHADDTDNVDLQLFAKDELLQPPAGGSSLMEGAGGERLELQMFAATATTAACGGNREELLGPRPAGCKARSRAEADAGSRNPLGGLDLQWFADGAASGDAGGAEGEAAPAVQAPALRPAQERMARRSRPGGAAKAAAEEKALLQPPAGGSSLGEEAKADANTQGKEKTGQSEGEEQKTGEGEEKKELTVAEKRRAFGKLMQGEYAAEFEEALQRASQATVQSIQNSPQVKALMDALGEAYGVDTASPDSLAALTEAVKNGRVKNDEYYETLAQEKGVSVKTAREMDRMEGELQRAAAEKQRAEQLRQAAEHQQRAAAVRAQWEAEAQKLQQKYPAFELDEVMNNPAVKDMILRGVGLEAAYRAAYFDQLMENQTALTAKQVEQGVEARIRQRGQRPAENGTHPGGAAETKVDVAHMTKAQRLELAKRARHGERIVL